MTQVLCFLGFKGCITVKRCFFLNIPSFSTCSNSYFHPLSHHIHITIVYFFKNLIVPYLHRIPLGPPMDHCALLFYYIHVSVLFKNITNHILICFCPLLGHHGGDSPA